MNLGNPALESRIQILKRVADSIGGDPIRDTVPNRLAMSGLAGAAAFGVSHLIHKRMPLSVAAGLGGLVAGYGSLPVANMMANRKNRNRSQKGISSLLTTGSDVAQSSRSPIETILNMGQPQMNKIAVGPAASIITLGLKSLYRGLAGGAKLGLRTAATTGRHIGKGLMPTGPNATLLEKARGIGVKGGAMIGGSMAVSGGLERMSNPAMASGHNYTTYLRNNALANNRMASQFSPSDIEDVRRLGMR